MTQAATRPGRHTFFCIDGHTCGNPVRLVAGGGPLLAGTGMSEKRQDFLARFDWVRTSLMFEPRGHDVMSGSILYPPTTADGDIGRAVHRGLGLPADVRAWDHRHRHHGPGAWAGEPQGAGPAPARHAGGAGGGGVRGGGPERRAGADHATSPPIWRCRRCGSTARSWASWWSTSPMAETSTPSSSPSRAMPGWRSSRPGKSSVSRPCCAGGSTSWSSPCIRRTRPSAGSLTSNGPAVPAARARTDATPFSTARRRSTAARAAPAPRPGWPSSTPAAGCSEGEDFIHESIIGSEFEGRVEGVTELGGQAAIIPSVAGWARTTGHNTIFVDERDPYWRGFQVA